MSPTGNTADFLLSEADGQRSRALFELPAGQGYLRAGTLLAASGLVATTPDAVAAVLYGSVDTGADDDGPAVKATAIDADAEVHGEMLHWPEDVTDSDKVAFSNALKAVGIRVRWTQRPEGLETDQVEPPEEEEGGEGGG